MKLTEPERRAFAAAHPEWTMEGETISRTVPFSGFRRAIAFVVEVGFLAEAADHHPDIDVRWNTVTLALSTHSEGALTEKDTNLAAAIDALT